MSKFAAVEFEGKEYILDGEADHTNRLIDNRQDNFVQVNEGEEFCFEMSAPAHDAEGNEYMIYWIFTDTKGSERELDSFDYDNIDRVELA
jgi:hypothetical protein